MCSTAFAEPAPPHLPSATTSNRGVAERRTGLSCSSVKNHSAILTGSTCAKAVIATEAHCATAVSREFAPIFAFYCVCPIWCKSPSFLKLRFAILGVAPVSGSVTVSNSSMAPGCTMRPTPLKATGSYMAVFNSFHNSVSAVQWKEMRCKGERTGVHLVGAVGRRHTKEAPYQRDEMQGSSLFYCRRFSTWKIGRVSAILSR